MNELNYDFAITYFDALMAQRCRVQDYVRLTERVRTCSGSTPNIVQCQEEASYKLNSLEHDIYNLCILLQDAGYIPEDMGNDPVQDWIDAGRPESLPRRY